MSREEGRRAVLDALREAGLLAGSRPHLHTVPRCYRCDTVVEPRLSKQWFVSMKPLAEPALQASRDGVVTFIPGRRRNDYEKWMENIRDWCVSRQLWWGHRIPVWYCACGETFAALEHPDVCRACGSRELEQDPDVLDTWFSSWLWPFSVFGWPRESEDLRVFYPGHVLSTAPEILFFWVARMIMSGFEFMGETPFTQVYLHGTVRDIKGHKMSKSRGNGIDPLEVVRRFGADALRYTMVAECGSAPISGWTTPIWRHRSRPAATSPTSSGTRDGSPSRISGTSLRRPWRMWRTSWSWPIAGCSRDSPPPPGKWRWRSSRSGCTRLRSDCVSFSGASSRTGIWRWSSLACARMREMEAGRRPRPRSPTPSTSSSGCSTRSFPS